MAVDWGVNIRTPLDTKIAFTEGKFNSDGQKYLRDKNKLIAEVVQSNVSRYMENTGFKRPSVSTGRLMRATADKQNIQSTPFRIRVGIPSFLDHSQAKYWRTIESGSASAWKKRPFTSLELVGYFGGTLSRWGIKGPHGGKPFTLPGGATGGKFIPVLGENPTFGRRKIPLRPFSPLHEIEPMHAYEWAFYNSHLSTDGIHAARGWLKIVIGRSLNPSETVAGPPGYLG